MRSFPRVVAACLASALFALAGMASSTSGDPPPPEAPPVRTLAELPGDGAPALFAVPRSASEAKRPFVVMLHGMCDTPENECPFFLGDATKERAVVCPRAPISCPGGGTQWQYKDAVVATLGSTLVTRAAKQEGAAIDAAHGTLVGFSQGAYLAVHVLKKHEKVYENVVLLGAKVELTKDLLDKAGVRSVVLASGEWDAAKLHMRAMAAKLQKAGVRARYVSLGQIGHGFSRDMDGFFKEQLAWLEAPQEEPAKAPAL